MADDARLDWRGPAAANFGATSHFRLFPSLLALMGYAPESTAPFYGATLIARERDPLTFTPTYYARLGRDPSWSRIVPSELAAPPVGDSRQLARAR